MDARSDLWAMGVIFYELLTGVRPFRRRHPGGHFRRHPLENTRAAQRSESEDPSGMGEDRRPAARKGSRHQVSIGAGSAGGLEAGESRFQFRRDSPPPMPPRRRGWRKYALAAGAGLILLAAIAYFLAAPDRLDRFSRDTSLRQRQSQRRCGLPERWHHRQPHWQSVQLAGLKGEVEKCRPQIQRRRHRCGPSRPGTGCGRRTDGPDRAAVAIRFPFAPT